jgi:hypothetical protein
MMGPRQVARGARFHEFSRERHDPDDHPLRATDRVVVDLGNVRARLAPLFSATARPRPCRPCSGPFNLLEEAPWPLPRARSVPRGVRGDGQGLHRGGAGGRQRFEPPIPVFGNAAHRDRILARTDFDDDHRSDTDTCPAGKTLRPRRRAFAKPRDGVGKDDVIKHRASSVPCRVCPLKPRCRPTTPEGKVGRSIFEGERDMAREITASDAFAVSSRRRKKVEMLFAHRKRILGLDRLRSSGPNGARDEFHRAAAARTLRTLARLTAQPTIPSPA